MSNTLSTILPIAISYQLKGFGLNQVNSLGVCSVPISHYYLKWGKWYLCFPGDVNMFENAEQYSFVSWVVCVVTVKGFAM